MRKRYLLFLLSCFFSLALSKAQTNLVPNPSFEIADTCPSTLDQVNYAHGWSSYGQSPDYFNVCNNTGLTPPNIGLAYQFPYSGNAYIGFIPYDISGTNYREIIGAQLISPLNVGTKYYFSFFLSFAGIPNYTSLAINKIGLCFSTKSYSTLDSMPINNNPNYYCTTIVKDTVNWIQLKSSFVADSAYKYIAIGNFFDDTHIFSSDTLGEASSYNYQSYYLIDNISLSTDSNIAYATGINSYNNFENISIYPNPCISELHIECNDYPKTIELFDMIGNLQLKTINNLNASKFTINVSSLHSGIYILKINTQNKIIIKEVLINNN